MIDILEKIERKISCKLGIHLKTENENFVIRFRSKKVFFLLLEIGVCCLIEKILEQKN